MSNYMKAVKTLATETSPETFDLVSADDVTKVIPVGTAGSAGRTIEIYYMMISPNGNAAGAIQGVMEIALPTTNLATDAQISAATWGAIQEAAQSENSVPYLFDVETNPLFLVSSATLKSKALVSI